MNALGFNYNPNYIAPSHISNTMTRYAQDHATKELWDQQREMKRGRYSLEEHMQGIEKLHTCADTADERKYWKGLAYELAVRSLMMEHLEGRWPMLAGSEEKIEEARQYALKTVITES
ncbi:hypothetical protein [Corynebacterium cystitidis]|uniref:hypothetical protein n=1 Tax=Corynebacterium cystitidis TaxID=35757 RepID=UPI00211E9758|nr:hypothetical protein [Corynebacterium cystitidis]